MGFRQYLLLLLVLSTSLNAAQVRYSYQGQDLSYRGLLSADAPLPGSANLTGIVGYFELSNALAPNLSMFALNGISSFAFTDGVTMLSDAVASIDAFQVSTDSFGNLTEWQLLLINPIAGTQTDDHIAMRTSSANSGSSSFAVYDSTDYFAGMALIGTESRPVIKRATSESSGQWSVSVVPLPTAAWLFGSALIGLGWMRRKAA